MNHKWRTYHDWEIYQTQICERCSLRRGIIYNGAQGAKVKQKFAVIDSYWFNNGKRTITVKRVNHPNNKIPHSVSDIFDDYPKSEVTYLAPYSCSEFGFYRLLS